MLKNSVGGDYVNVELEATMALKTLIMRNPYLQPFIDENDRTPIWDGYVYVYSDKNPNHPKKSFVGRVPMQVKGKSVDTTFDDTIKYRVKKEDLNAYEKDGGVIFIVVLIKKHSDEIQTQIYYKELLPFDLARVRGELEDNKSCNLDFEKIPMGDEELANLFLNFHENKTKQSGTVDNDRLYFEDWKESLDSIECFKLSYVGVKEFNPFEIFTTKPLPIYIKPKGFNTLIPVDRITDGVMTTSCTVGAGDIIFFTDAKTVWKNGEPRVFFGKNSSIVVPKNQNKVIVNISIKGSLHERIADGAFFKALYQERILNINGCKWPPLDEFTHDTMEELMRYLDVLDELQETLKKINITNDLLLDELENVELWKLGFVMNINRKTGQKPDTNSKTPLRIIDIANLRLLVFMNEEDGFRKVEDYFSHSYRVVATDSYGKKQNASQFLILEADALISDNFVASVVYDDVIKYADWSGSLCCINRFLLEVIKAYDLDRGKHEELFDLATRLSIWLCEQSDEPSYKMNQLQIKLRNSKLSDSEIEFCRKLTDDENNWDIRCGANILLGNYDTAKKILKKQKDEDVEEFKSYPIYYLLTKK